MKPESRLGALHETEGVGSAVDELNFWERFTDKPLTPATIADGVRDLHPY